MKKDKDIILPYELVTSNLSLKEIGAIFTSHSFLQMTSEEIEKYDDEEYYDIIEDLVNRGVISIDCDINNETSTMSINLEKLSQDEPFWEIEDYDDYGNPTYTHYVNYDNDSEWKYMIRPVLIDMKVEWRDCSDIELNLGCNDQSFKSLEEAEKYYKILIKLYLKNNYIEKEHTKNEFWVYDAETSRRECNESYRHRYDYVDFNYDMLYLGSMRSTSGTMWKLSTSLGAEDRPELFETKEEAQEYCEGLINQENLKNNVSR